MVTFNIEYKGTDKVTYIYFPENHYEKAYGVFSISLVNRDIILEVIAEEDFLCRTSAQEFNEMRDTINEMRKENGEPPLTEEEFPIVTEDKEWYQYADHAIRKVKEEIEKGIIPENGTVVWY